MESVSLSKAPGVYKSVHFDKVKILQMFAENWSETQVGGVQYQNQLSVKKNNKKNTHE